MIERIKITGPMKASLLLLSLGEDLSSEVLRHLDKNEIQQLTGIMGKMDGLTLDSLNTVLEEFCLEVEKHVDIPPDGADYIKKVLTKAVGKERADAILRDADLTDVHGESVLKTLSKLDSESLGKFLEAEHPQVVALILAHLEQSKAGEVLSILPEDLQQEVVWRVANLETIDPNILLEIDRAFAAKIDAATVRTQRVGGVQSVVEILQQVSKASEQSILGYIGEKSSELAEEIKELMFTFEDLAMLEDRSIQTILKEINRDTLVLSLRGASNSVRNKLFRNMSSEASEILQEDMEALGPVRLRDAEKAQKDILNVVRKLEEEGTLVLGGRGEDDVLI